MEKLNKKINKYILRRVEWIFKIPARVAQYLQTRHEVRGVLRTGERSAKRIICFLFCEHGNIGDQAIVEGEISFLGHHFREYSLVYTSYYMWHYAKDIIKKNIRMSDILIIHGGGFIGTLWFKNELRCREIISAFPHNRIICFPQTIYFEDSPWGASEIKKTKDIWEAHRNYFICTREKQSYDFSRLHFNTPCYLIPDIVLYLNCQEGISLREGVITCFRSDKEKTVKDDVTTQFISALKQSGLSIRHTDTVQPYNIPFVMRKAEVQKKLNEFRSAKLVVTDRLHGMIFAAITGTPCVALNNLSGKVGAVYQWIKYLDYIKFAQTMEEAFEMTDALLKADLRPVWDNSPLMGYFEKLADIVRGDLSEE